MALAEVPEPGLQEPDDAIVRVTAAGICGSDLHLLHERVPGMRVGSIVGHEVVGTVHALGDRVDGFSVGDRVVVSFSIACGGCWSCARGEQNGCEDARALGYGEFLGDLDGGQADFVRIPHADTNLHAIPEGVSDEAAVLAGDILSTGFYIASRCEVSASDEVAIIGAGPVGLMTLLACRARRASRVWVIDREADRLEVAASLGAVPVDASAVDPVVALQKETQERGPDVVIECVGSAATFATSIDMVRANGRVGVIGVHTDIEVEFPLGEAWRRGISIIMGGTACVHSHWDEALDALASGAIDPVSIITDRLPLDRALEGYQRFEAREALKVILIP